jgi:hypothetical protein
MGNRYCDAPVRSMIHLGLAAKDIAGGRQRGRHEFRFVPVGIGRPCGVIAAERLNAGPSLSSTIDRSEHLSEQHRDVECTV